MEFVMMEPGDEYYSDDESDDTYYEPCEFCGGRVVSTGGNYHYNGNYNCYTMYLDCENCGPYEIECV